MFAGRAGPILAITLLASMLIAGCAGATATPQPQLVILNCIRAAHDGDPSKLLDALAQCRNVDPTLFDNLIATYGSTPKPVPAGVDPLNGYPMTPWSNQFPFTVSGTGNYEVAGIVLAAGVVQSTLTVTQPASGTCEGGSLHMESDDPGVTDTFDSGPVLASASKSVHGTASGSLAAGKYFLTISADPGCSWTVELGR